MTAPRVLLVLLLATLVAGTPGLGLETRAGSAVAGLLYGIPFLAAIAALIASFRSPAWTRRLAWVAGASAILLSLADLVGLMDPQRPALAVAVVEVAAIVVSLVLLYRTRAADR